MSYTSPGAWQRTTMDMSLVAGRAPSCGTAGLRLVKWSMVTSRRKSRGREQRFKSPDLLHAAAALDELLTAFLAICPDPHRGSSAEENHNRLPGSSVHRNAIQHTHEPGTSHRGSWPSDRRIVGG